MIFMNFNRRNSFFEGRNSLTNIFKSLLIVESTSRDEPNFTNKVKRIEKCLTNISDDPQGNNISDGMSAI